MKSSVLNVFTTTEVKNFHCVLFLFCFSETNKPAAKTEDLVLSVLIGLFSDLIAASRLCSLHSGTSCVFVSK